MDLYQLTRPILFSLDPETAHDLGLVMAHKFPWLASSWKSKTDKSLNCQVGRIKWKSPVGLAAGLDKNAVALNFFNQLGFGSMECGTITVKPQHGNPKPRIHRYPDEASLRNSMGFPNSGSEFVLQKLKDRPEGFPVGVNIGKSKEATPIEAIDEYVELYDKLSPYGDWVIVNISSPNTPGLRDLQQESWLKDLFHQLAPLRKKYGKEIHVKLAPDMDDDTFIDLCSSLADLGVDGLVATNTTHIPERGVGGVSGQLLRVKAHQKRRLALKVARDRKLSFVGVGGFQDMNDVYAFWASGGSAFQIYTSLIFQGPGIIKNFTTKIDSFLSRAGINQLQTFLDLDLPERQKIIGSFGKND